MAEAEKIILAIVLGIVLGIPIGWMLAQLTGNAGKKKLYGIILDRDERGLISGIIPTPLPIGEE